MMKHVRSYFATPAACMVAICLLLSSSTAFAAEIANEPSSEGPTASDGRPLYTEETRPDFPVFNSLVGEENFLHVTSPDGTVTTSGSVLELQMGQQYDVIVSYDNNGLPTGVRTHAIASDTTLLVDMPSTLTDERTLTATITAANSQPAAVSTSLTLLASEPMALEFVQGSAKVVNQDPTNGTSISDDELFHRGVSLGSNSMIGIVLYGSEHAGSVVFSFRTIPIAQAATSTTGQAIDDAEIITPPTSSSASSQSAASVADDWTFAGILGVIFSASVLISIIACAILDWRSRRR